MAKYIYGGNRDSNNTASGIEYTAPGSDSPQGTVYEEGQPPEIRVGDTIDLTAGERDRLLPYFILTNKDGEDQGEGLVPPSAAPIDSSADNVNDTPSPAVVDPAQSGSGDTIPPSATTSDAPKQ